MIEQCCESGNDICLLRITSFVYVLYQKASKYTLGRGQSHSTVRRGIRTIGVKASWNRMEFPVDLTTSGFHTLLNEKILRVAICMGTMSRPSTSFILVGLISRSTV